MRRYGGRLAAPGMLALLVALGGCGSTTGQFADGLFAAPWGGMRPNPPGDSLTVARVRGVDAQPAPPLMPEAGNVWPAEEAPRATLANPDAALRGIPSYRPSDGRQLDSMAPPPPEPAPRRNAATRRGSSSPPPSALTEPELPRLASPQPGLPSLPPPPAPRTDGQVVLTPNGPVVTSGGTDRVQSYIAPGGGTGLITRDGPTAIITGPDGRVQAVPNPR